MKPAATIAAEDVRVPLRDGVTLRADLYRPAGAGRHPVLVMRNPYDRRVAQSYLYAHPSWYAAQGYAVLSQDMRGRWGSDGRFDPLVNEGPDGADTVAWAAEQPWSNGRVGMYGFSYPGMSQLLTAAELPDGLRAAVPALAPSQLRTGWLYNGGAFALAFALGWAIELGVDQASRRSPAPGAGAAGGRSRPAPLVRPPAPARPAAVPAQRALRLLLRLDRARDRQRLVGQAAGRGPLRQHPGTRAARWRLVRRLRRRDAHQLGRPAPRRPRSTATGRRPLAPPAGAGPGRTDPLRPGEPARPRRRPARLVRSVAARPRPRPDRPAAGERLPDRRRPLGRARRLAAARRPTSALVVAQPRPRERRLGRRDAVDRGPGGRAARRLRLRPRPAGPERRRSLVLRSRLCADGPGRPACRRGPPQRARVHLAAAGAAHGGRRAGRG